jgi:hypothetical protein
MADNPTADLNREPALAPLECPHCGLEIAAAPWPQECPQCRHPFDLDAQFAYCRGHNAFTVGQDLLMASFRQKRKGRLPPPDEVEGLECYMQAYSALQQAFHGKLAESQRQLSIRMMASIVQVFQHNTMVSPMEASYWSTLLVELNSRAEIATLQQKLGQRNPLGPLGWPLRWRWQTRIRQLNQALAELDQKLRMLERRIGFTERMHVRNKA